MVNTQVQKVRKAFRINNKIIQQASVSHKPMTAQKNLLATGRSRESVKQSTKKFSGSKIMGVHSFPGEITNSNNYPNGTPGLFTQSVDGIEGKHYIETAIKTAISKYMRND